MKVYKLFSHVYVFCSLTQIFYSKDGFPRNSYGTYPNVTWFFIKKNSFKVVIYNSLGMNTLSKYFAQGTKYSKNISCSVVFWSEIWYLHLLRAETASKTRGTLRNLPLYDSWNNNPCYKKSDRGRTSTIFKSTFL